MRVEQALAFAEAVDAALEQRFGVVPAVNAGRAARRVLAEGAGIAGADAEAVDFHPPIVRGPGYAERRDRPRSITMMALVSQRRFRSVRHALSCARSRLSAVASLRPSDGSPSRS